MSTRLDTFLVATALVSLGVAGGCVLTTTIGPEPAPAVTTFVTQRVTLPPKTLPPKTVTITRTVERASRSGRISTPERLAGMNTVVRKYWIPAQGWAQRPKTRAVIACESSNRVNAVSRTGKYRGLFQMDRNFWRSYGGLTFAPTPDRASRAAQNYVAYRGFVSRGWAPWACA